MSEQQPFEPETDWDRLIEQMGRLKADLARIQEEATADDVHFELQSQISFFAGDFDTFVRDLIAYEHGDEMPDECPVCGDPVVQLDALEPGESYDADRLCIDERSHDGIWHGMIHLPEEGETA